ncbi:MAG TPA: tryptophan--tRNA ligase [Candidatus Paceibacterota bacterium]|nr:tryptophan--tRNA ligase [Candidatus Paceibacterota bacterium]
MSKVFSGIRSSGRLHLGNYLGAIKNWVALQDSAEQCIFAVVDLHGITTPYDPAELPAAVMDTALDFLAAGVDPSKALLIRQSHIPQHSELMWLLSSITPVGWLERLPNWREKVKQVEDIGGDRARSYQNNLALLAYPVLMAADILVYKSDLIPVGEDQLAHLDLANEIGAKFNHLFGGTFPAVKRSMTEGARIMSLTDPLKKMSKTGDDGIALSDAPDVIREKIKRATTDSGHEIKFDEVAKPGISNLLTIASVLGGKSVGDLEEEFDGVSYSEFKAAVAEIVVGALEPFQARRAKLAADPAEVLRILTASEEKARILAAETLDEVHSKMGLR